MMEPFYIDALGRWSYPFVVSLYVVTLVIMMRYFRVTFRFSRWKVFFANSVVFLLILGFGFELIAGIFRAWEFDPDRHLFDIHIPLYGWITGHKIPVSEAIWIIAVVPLFYYFYLWCIFMFNDIIYVVDKKGKLYKREQRWVGLRGVTRLLVRPKGKKGRRYEKVMKTRKPGKLAFLLELVVRGGIS